jgi:hypothetical protein
MRGSYRRRVNGRFRLPMRPHQFARRAEFDFVKTSCDSTSKALVKVDIPVSTAERRPAVIKPMFALTLLV